MTTASDTLDHRLSMVLDSDLADQLGKALQRRSWRLAVAESATGGLLGHWITAVSGGA
jgi:nicotinamide mononucleotide (NMN) deamidase PncC